MTTSTQSTQSQSQTAPWAPQQGPILQGINDAQGAYTQAQGATNPTGFVAGLTPEQVQTFNGMTNYGNTNQTPGQLSSSGTGAVNTGTGALNGAAAGYGNYDPTATNNMGANIAGANSYVNGINIPAQVANAMQTANEQARDVTLPGMEANAAANGNINSSRTGLGEGMVQRGLAETAANLSGTLSNNAYATGANLASNTNTINNAAQLAALQGQSNLGLGALTQGSNNLTNSVNTQGNLYGIAATGGQGMQGGNQSDLNNQMAQWQFQTQSPYAALQQFMSIVGQPYGSQSSGTSTTQSTPSFIQTLGGLIGAGSSLIGTSGNSNTGAGATGLSALLAMSDRRTKRDIEKVGSLNNGTPLYRFSYIGDATRQKHVGLMAQDVEKYAPEAVAEIRGIKHVDYGTAIQQAMREAA